MFKAIRGTKDILPAEACLWQTIEEKARDIFSLYGYRQIRTPIIEEASLFSRSLGKSSEIVQKQMFQIQRDKEVFVLRPEATAAVVRSYIENNFDKKQGFAKFYYIGPMFRAERPQKGRLRQFHHLGVEAIGSLSPLLDIEVICLASKILNDSGVKNFKIQINSLGCIKDKQRLAESLRSKLASKLEKLCPNCNDRFKRNVFRILDCKEETCRKVCQGLKLEEDNLCPDCSRHFQQVKDGLKSLGVQYQVMPSLVRGLDYYTRTVFEIVHDSLGSQDALGAGGRYDSLVSDLGGPSLGAIGFALGLERIIIAKDKTDGKQTGRLVYLIALGDAAKKEVLKLLYHLRNNKIQADTDYQDKSLKAAMRRASDLKARFVVIIGEDEIKSGLVTLKDMESGEQTRIGQAALGERLK